MGRVIECTEWKEGDERSEACGLVEGWSIKLVRLVRSVRAGL